MVLILAMGLIQMLTGDWRATSIMLALIFASVGVALRFPRHATAGPATFMAGAIVLFGLMPTDRALPLLYLAWLVPLASVEILRLRLTLCIVTKPGAPGLMIRNGRLEHQIEPGVSVDLRAIDPLKVLVIANPFFGEPRISVTTEFGRRTEFSIAYMTPAGERIAAAIREAVIAVASQPINLADAPRPWDNDRIPRGLSA